MHTAPKNRAVRALAAVCGVVLVATLLGPVPAEAYSGVQYRDLQNRIAFPRTTPTTSRPAIRGHAGADQRIHALAERRGYRLRPVHNANLTYAGGVPLDPAAAQAFAALIGDARRAGHHLGAAYGYRSVDLQRRLFLNRISSVSNSAIAAGRADGVIDAALRWVAPPGYSKHHTGFAIDLRSLSGSAGSFASSAVGRWIRADDYARARARGFVPSYPSGAGAQGPEPEPWEFVYVGPDVLRCAHRILGANDPHAVDACLRNTPISRTYLRHGGPTGFLGVPVHGERAASDRRGRVAVYRGGTIYWTATTGAREVHGDLLDLYERVGGPHSSLGYPTTDTRTSANGRWRYNNLEGGRLYHDRSGTGTFRVVEPMFTKHESHGGINGVIGIPIANPARSTDGRAVPYQNFSAGRIYAPDGWAVEIHGAVYTWHEREAGGVRGEYGYPVTDLVTVVPGVKEQWFEGGAIWYRPDTGVIGLQGPTGVHYLRNGGVRGHAGLPTSEAQPVGDGVGTWAGFQRGRIYERDGQAHQVHGAVLDWYLAQGGPTGPAGYPTSDLDPAGSPRRIQHFEGTQVEYVKETNSVVVLTPT